MKTTSKQQILSRITDIEIHKFLNHFDDVKWEQAAHSVKIMNRNVNRNRLLLGMRSADITFKKLSKKLLELNFPENKLTEMENQYSQSNDLGFAIENTIDGIDCRVYFEMKYTNSRWFEVKNERMKNNDYYTMPLFVGYKWFQNNTKLFISKYDFIQFTDGDGLIKRIKEISNYVPNCIINALKNKTEEQAREYIVMEVKDVESKRFSYDIRFNINKIYLKDFSAKEIMENFRVNLDVLKDFSDVSIGHISGGKDKQGDDFITLYFAV